MWYAVLQVKEDGKRHLVRRGFVSRGDAVKYIKILLDILEALNIKCVFEVMEYSEVGEDLEKKINE